MDIGSIISYFHILNGGFGFWDGKHAAIISYIAFFLTLISPAHEMKANGSTQERKVIDDT